MQVCITHMFIDQHLHHNSVQKEGVSKTSTMTPRRTPWFMLSSLSWCITNCKAKFKACPIIRDENFEDIHLFMLIQASLLLSIVFYIDSLFVKRLGNVCTHYIWNFIRENIYKTTLIVKGSQISVNFKNMISFSPFYYNFKYLQVLTMTFKRSLKP